MAEDNPGLLERMVRLQRARDEYEQALREDADMHEPRNASNGTAALYIELLEAEAYRVGVLVDERDGLGTAS